jgi:hypothetical protein
MSRASITASRAEASLPGVGVSRPGALSAGGLRGAGREPAVCDSFSFEIPGGEAYLSL